MADDARPTADLIERDEVPVLFLRVRDDVDEMSRAWERLEAVVGLRGRKLYRAFDARTLEYRVCVLAKERDDPTVFGLESGTLPGGRYLRARLRGEPPEVYTSGSDRRSRRSSRRRVLARTRRGRTSSTIAAATRSTSSCRSPNSRRPTSRGYALGVTKVRLGGMALSNGVLVHGPTAWACAIRTDAGEIKIASARKRVLAPRLQQPFLRGPIKLVESFAFLPELRRKLPEARLPFERPAVLAATLAGAATVQVVRRSNRLGDTARELLSGALSLAPALLALRGGELAAYHGAEHVSIGSYEHGVKRAKEHERCGSHLIGPLLAASAAGNVLAARAPKRLRGTARLGSSIGAVGIAVEVFAWMTKHPQHPLSKALARPGHELQHRIATAEPSAAQLEVAEAALAACLELEG